MDDIYVDIVNNVSNTFQVNLCILSKSKLLKIKILYLRVFVSLRSDRDQYLDHKTINFSKDLKLIKKKLFSLKDNIGQNEFVSNKDVNHLNVFDTKFSKNPTFYMSQMMQRGTLA